jgi:PAS domain S-box-containing protein
MGERIRKFDWSATSLGPIDVWPQSLRSALSICLNSNFPIALYWGADLVLLYNDEWSPIPGEKHPWALGRPAREAWPEIWHIIEPLFQRVMATGEATRSRDQLLPMHRHGFTEECYFDYTFSPIRGEGGEVQGVFNAVLETTNRVIGERRLRTLRELGAWHEARTTEEACRTATRVIAENPHDLPFALLYLLGAGRRAVLAGSTGLGRDASASPDTIYLDTPDAAWPFRRVAETGKAVEVDALPARFGQLTGGAWPESPRRAVVLPLAKPGLGEIAGFVVAGVSPRLALNDDYRGFLDLLAGHVAAAVASARGYEEERKRAEELAELDRAKTAFFSNVSHEFRTPLTLMLGPVEDALADAESVLPPAQRERIEVVHRNGLRLQRLVNALLDFSRIEAGRVQASYEPTDLAAFTADLASNFRSACEKAGLTMTVDCPPLSEPVFVDRPMWEKVVLNLLSNSFKFTLQGGIAVTLGQEGRSVELRVRDTGTGIPAAEMPRLFERFHRVENARGRTHEGSGIGLALVQELVKLHGGSIAAESEVGQGTTFTVTLPLGADHLPRERVGSGDTHAPATDASPFVQEALRWLPDAGGSDDPGLPEQPSDLSAPVPTSDIGRPRVLVADDNSDMRRYVQRLLSSAYTVEAVPDGGAALAAVRRSRPDLILSDVMMPRLDGFGLLRELRADAATATIPVILLSARAGDESRVEGVQAGADDYLVKPFNAKELLVRVAAQLQMARLRLEAQEAVRRGEERFRLFMSHSPATAYIKDEEGRYLFVNRVLERAFRRPLGDWVGRTDLDLFPPGEAEQFRENDRRVLATGEPVEFVETATQDDGLHHYLSFKFPLWEGDGQVLLAGMSLDITTQRRAEETLRRNEEYLRAVVETTPACIKVVKADGTLISMNPAGLAILEADSLDEVQGRSAYGFVTDAYRAAYQEFNERVCRGESGTMEYEIRGLRGTRRQLASHAAPIPGPDGSLRQLAIAYDITDRKQAEERERALLVKSATANAQFRAFFEQGALFAGIMRTDGTLIETNRLTLDACGYTREQAIGNLFWDCPWWNRSPELMQRIKDATALAATGKTFRAELPYFTADGGERTVDFILLPITDEAGRVMFLAPTGTDITDRKRAERQLAEAHEFLHSSLDALSSHIAVLDERGVILAVNDAWRRFADENQYTGRNYGLGTNYVEACEPDAVECVDADMVAGLRGVLAGRLPYFEFEYPCHSPTEDRWFVMRATRFKSPGPVRVVVAHENVTTRKLAEDALKDADRRKDEFLATLAHELRNPLAPIRNGLQIMRLSHGDRETVEKARTMMERQLGQMVHLVDDLLDLSRISRGKIELRKERVELARVVQQAVETSRPVIEASSHDLTITVPPGPIYVDADVTRLAQVFSNLLNNAAKYTERGGRVRLSVRRQGSEAIVSVRDNGVGIPAHMLPRVFEMFTQVDRHLERSQGGLGIGLSIVKKLVEMHGGSVSVESDGPGTGSEFTVRLPVVLSVAEPTADDEEEPTRPSRRRKVLVVDDNVDAAVSLAMMLDLMGSEAKTAHDGLEALEVAAAYRPDLILLDIGMPRLDGHDTAKRIRQQPWGKDVVLVALTGWGQEEDRRKSEEAGFDAHMTKPIEPAALEKLLATLQADTA